MCKTLQKESCQKWCYQQSERNHRDEIMQHILNFQAVTYKKHKRICYIKECKKHVYTSKSSEKTAQTKFSYWKMCVKSNYKSKEISFLHLIILEAILKIKDVSKIRYAQYLI